MNTERILDIALAATPNIKRTQGDIGGKSWIAAKGIPPQSVERFAELIVKECVAQCDKNKDHEWLGAGSKVSAFNIKQHFGVKE